MRSDAGAAPLLRLLLGQWRYLLPALGLVMLAVLAELAPYLLFYQAAQWIVAGVAEPSAWFRLAGGLALASTARYVLLTGAGALSHQAAFRLLCALRQAIVHKLAQQPLPKLAGYRSGELVRTVLQEVEQIEGYIAHHSVDLSAAVIGPLAAGALLAWLDWRLALAALLTLLPATGAQAWLFRDLSQQIARYQHATATLHAAVIDYVRAVPVMKVFLLDSRSFAQMRAALATYHHCVSDFARRIVPGWSAFSSLLSANLLFTLPLAWWLHARGELDIPGLVLALALASGGLRPLQRAVTLTSKLQETRLTVDKISALLRPATEASNVDAPALPDDAQAAKPPPALRIRGLSLTRGARRVLDDINLDVAAGSMVAVVGRSGAGKSSLAMALGGLLAPDRGYIQVGGQALAGLSDATRAARIAVVTQHSFLFRGSIADNLRLASPVASDTALRRAASVAQADDFIMALPERYDTLLGEGGLRLSGGEAQRLAIARAILADTPLLILDEATAFADALIERAFLAALRAQAPHRTIVAITHRLHALPWANQIVVLDGGRVVASGPHDALLATVPLYQALWERQWLSNSTPQDAAGAARRLRA
ncbi:ABC transporter ATP-binding protein [Cupriavidus basilensis]|uniref:ABC transporter ATP-binding protein n=1 Tax=Cupriavidus basilensis TaxID=68895 RepID=A0ABT6B5H3_9BURK|nr:ABC transporter ATP-binding protein [Cupriavidus basilensis]MDF3839201.1 ABC transporter ATP-binding protein [Cupriavidus basilensis]